MKIAVFDAGTTAVKGVLITENGQIIAVHSVPITTWQDGMAREQDPDEWYKALCEITHTFKYSIGFEDLSGIIISGQMQDLILIGKNGMPVRRAILYSDGRSGRQADKIMKTLQASRLSTVTGNAFNGLMPVARLKWLEENEPEVLSQIAAVLISSKDYLNYRLTGELAGDYTSLSTAGALNIRKKTWDSEILNACGAKRSWMPKPCSPQEEIGKITKHASAQTLLPEGVPVYEGIGDAGASALASGILSPGEYSINLGTTGWVATVSDHVFDDISGCFNLAFLSEDLYINVVPFLNGANVYSWICRLFSKTGTSSEKLEDWDFVERNASLSPVGSSGVRCLPYFSGERFPVMNPFVRGAYVGITCGTTEGDLIRSTLEGIAFSIRQGIETIGIEKKYVSLIGGGARVKLWQYIMADVLGCEIRVLSNPQYQTAFSLVNLVLAGQGKVNLRQAIADSRRREKTSIRRGPDSENVHNYDIIYKDYLRLYPSIKNYYQPNG